MIASDRILKMITLIRMFGAARSAPTAEDDLATTAAEPISPELVRLLRFSKPEESRDQGFSS